MVCGINEQLIFLYFLDLNLLFEGEYVGNVVLDDDKVTRWKIETPTFTINSQRHGNELRFIQNSTDPKEINVQLKVNPKTYQIFAIASKDINVYDVLFANIEMLKEGNVEEKETCTQAEHIEKVFSKFLLNL